MTGHWLVIQVGQVDCSNIELTTCSLSCVWREIKFWQAMWSHDASLWSFKQTMWAILTIPHQKVLIPKYGDSFYMLQWRGLSICGLLFGSFKIRNHIDIMAYTYAGILKFLHIYKLKWCWKQEVYFQISMSFWAQKMWNYHYVDQMPEWSQRNHFDNIPTFVATNVT